MQSVAHLEPHAIATASDLGRARVLLVEDDLPMRGAMCRALMDDGHLVETATHGREAIARIERGKWFDVIFCDTLLADVTAEEFRQRVALFSLFQANRIVFLSSGGKDPQVDDPLASTRNEILQRPVLIELVLAKVRQAITDDE